MRHFAPRLGLALTVVALAAPAAAQATGSPPKIVTSFTPNLIGVSATTALEYTITNPNLSGSVYALSFSDTLPGSVAIDNPNGVVVSGCGSADTVTANPGTSTVSATGIVVKALTPCTVVVAVIANTNEIGADTLGPLTYSTSSTGSPVSPAPVSSETPATLTVLEAPAVTVTSPKNNAKYRYGQVVKVSYSCIENDYALAIQGCTAQDDLGDTVNSGDKLDTKTPGAHELDVEGVSISGGTTDDVIDYTVLPDNRFTIGSLRAKPSGALSFKLSVPGAGRVAVAEFAAGRKIAAKTAKVSGKRTLGLTLRPSFNTLTAHAKRATHTKYKLEVTYTPTGGRPSTRTKVA